MIKTVLTSKLICARDSCRNLFIRRIIILAGFFNKRATLLFILVEENCLENPFEAFTDGRLPLVKILLSGHLTTSIFKHMKTYIVILFSCTLVSCGNKIYLHRIKTYLSASTRESKGRFLSDDFQSFFLEWKGEGKNKTTALQSFLNWDAPLHPDVSVTSYKAHANTWTVQFVE